MKDQRGVLELTEGGQIRGGKGQNRSLRFWG